MGKPSRSDFVQRRKSKRLDFARHSHASLLINQGYDALVIADRLGHENVSTTLNTYSHMFPHKQQEMVDSLQSLGGKAIPTQPSPDDIFSLDIFEKDTREVIVPIGPMLKELDSGKVIQMPIRSVV